MARASTNAENNALNGMVLGAGGTYVGTPAYLAPDDSRVEMRIGLHVGPVTAGIVGSSMLRYQ